VRKLEQGKKTLRLDKVNQVLSIFAGSQMAPAKMEREALDKDKFE